MLTNLKESGMGAGKGGVGLGEKYTLADQSRFLSRHFLALGPIAAYYPLGPSVIHRRNDGASLLEENEP